LQRYIVRSLGHGHHLALHLLRETCPHRFLQGVTARAPLCLLLSALALLQAHQGFRLGRARLLCFLEGCLLLLEFFFDTLETLSGLGGCDGGLLGLLMRLDQGRLESF